MRTTLQVRHPPAKATALWAALRRASEGLTAAEGANRGLGSEPYLRRALRAWAAGGFATVEEGEPGVSGHRYRLAPDAPAEPPVVPTAGPAVARAAAMTPREFAAVRRLLGLNTIEMGRRLGWGGKDSSTSRSVRRFEQGSQLIDEALAEKVRALGREQLGG